MGWTRRRCLKALGWSTAGIVVAAGAGALVVDLPALPHRSDPDASDAALWISLRPDGTVEIVSPRAEMGQGIGAAFRRIVAAETGVAFERICVVNPRTDRIPPARATVGSDSIRDYAPLIAKASAALASAARRRAAEMLALPPERVRIAGDAVLAEDGRALPLAEVARTSLMVDAAAVEAAVPASLAPRAARTDFDESREPDGLRAVVTGAAPLYADDVRLPGMIFGAMLRPPLLGARLEAVGDVGARDLVGYIGLHREGDVAGVAAESQGALERALERIEARWSGGTVVSQREIDDAVDVDRNWPGSSGEHVSGEHVVLAGAVDARTPFDVDLRLDVPMAAHAAMEPRCAVARVQDSRLEVWTGSQDVTFVARVLARELSLAEADVSVYGQRLGGGFGGRTICSVELEAARLARAFGRPVKVRWTRKDEFANAFHRPPSSHRIAARLARDGRIVDWRHRFRSGHVIFTSAAMGPVLQAVTSFVADPGVARGAIPPYATGAADVRFSDVRLPVDTGPWRGLGAAPNCWAVETAVDALARHAGKDAVAFRLANLPPEAARLARVLERVAALSGWSERRSDAARGYGAACGVYKDMAYAAVVAEVTMEAGAPRVTRLWCAHDCGHVIDPDGVRAQIEGNLVWSIGMTLRERLTIAEGAVAQSNFGDYALPVFGDVPPMIVELVDDGHPPTGAGETAIVAGPAAITNAITAITGRIVTRLPYDPLNA